MGTISGEIRDENGDLLADCVVRAYRRDTGALLASGLSGDGSEEQAGDPDYASVALLLHCDGTNGSTTFTDSSGTPKTVTAYGNAAISTAQSKFGGASAYFDGSGDYLTVAQTSALNFGSGDMTIEFWLRTTQSTSNASLLCKDWNTGAGVAIQLNGNSSGPLTIYWESFSSSTPLMQGTGSTHRDGNWHHFAWTKAGNVHRMFLDGTQVATATTSTAFADDTNLWTFGNDLSFSGRSYLGYLDEIRVTKGVARYTADFTPPSAAFVEGTIPARPLGAYTLTTTHTDEVQVIALDPDGGTMLNDLILRTTPV